MSATDNQGPTLEEIWAVARRFRGLAKGYKASKDEAYGRLRELDPLSTERSRHMNIYRQMNVAEGVWEYAAKGDRKVVLG